MHDQQGRREGHHILILMQLFPVNSYMVCIDFLSHASMYLCSEEL